MKKVKKRRIHEKCDEKVIKICKTIIFLEGTLKNWTAIKNEYHLLETTSYKWVQLVDGLKTPWKQSIRK